jgi:hypothetical protein
VFVERLSSRLLVEKECFCGVFRAEEATGGERRENVGWKKNMGEADFFGLFWTRFSPPSGHQIHLYL